MVHYLPRSSWRLVVAVKPRNQSWLSTSNFNTSFGNRNESTTTNPSASVVTPTASSSFYFYKNRKSRTSNSPPPPPPAQQQQQQQQQQTLATTNAVVFTPRMILQVFDRALISPDHLETQWVHVKGFLERRRSALPPKIYGGFIYETLLDPNDESVSLRLKISQNLYFKLFGTGNSQAVVDSNDNNNILNRRRMLDMVGFVTRKLRNDCAVQFLLEVTHAESASQVTEEQPSEQERAKWSLLQRRANQERVNVKDLFRKKLLGHEKPRLLLITGENSIVDQDVEKALQEAVNLYSLSWHRVNLASPRPLLQLLATRTTATETETETTTEQGKEGMEVDAVAVVRGGGEGLEVFDDTDLCEQVLESRVPIASAVGHAADTVLLEQVADCSFATPTALGTWLHNLAVETMREVDESELLMRQKVKREQQLEREYQKQTQGALLQQLEHGKAHAEGLLADKKALQDRLLQMEENAQRQQHLWQEQLHQIASTAKQERDALEQQLRELEQTKTREQRNLQADLETMIRWNKIIVVASGVMAALATIFQVLQK